MFRVENRHIRILIDLPDPKEKRFVDDPRYPWKSRSESAARAAWEQACRQRWRALALVVKAKLEAVESGISTVEQEFMAHIVLPDGQTVGQFMAPQLERAYAGGRMPSPIAALLPAPEREVIDV